MKPCVKCKRPKSEFKMKGLVQTNVCTDCEQEYQHLYYIAHKSERIRNARVWDKKHRKQVEEFLFEYLSTHSCVDCSESDVLVLEFDHNDPEKKTLCVSQMLSHSFKNVQQEVMKCTVRCANCHRRKTSHKNGNWKLKYIPARIPSV